MPRVPAAVPATSLGGEDLLDAIVFPAAVLDARGVIVAVNSAWSRFAIDNGPGGGEPARRTGPGTSYLEVCRNSRGASSEHAETVLAGLSAVLEGRSAEFVHQYRCDSPTRERWFTLTATPRPGALGGAVVVHVDVTPTRHIERENRDLVRRLELGQRLEAVGRLASGVAHDHNNMLAVISGHVELALETLPPGHPARENLQEILLAAGRSASLTRQLLALARRQPARPRVLSPALELEHCVRMLRRLVPEDIALTLEVKPDTWNVRMDPQQLDHVVTNLCLNARDALPGRGCLALSAENVVVDGARAAGHPVATPGPHVAIRVRDDGAGMTPEVIAHAFEPFFTTKSAGLGTGLGLATVHGMVSQNGGFVEVESAPGRGTTMTVLLPRSFAPATDPFRDDTEEVASLAATVLVVEDEPALLTLLERMLLDLGCTVLAAPGGEEALALAAAHPGSIELVLTDVLMPGLSGRQVVEQLTAVRPGVRHLYMSGHVADVVARHGLLAPDTHFLPKPFGRTELARELASVLGVRDAAGPEDVQ